MTGAHDSVIGMQKEIAIKRFLYRTPFRYEAATADLHVSAVLISIDEDTRRARSIKKVFWPEWGSVEN